MAIKSERIELRLDEELVQQIDDWRRQQSELSTRSEAIRRLVQQGLSSSSKQAFMLIRTHLILAAHQRNSEDLVSDATLFAWTHDVYPGLTGDAEELAEPFASCFSVSSDMLTQLGKFLDNFSLRRKTVTFYEIEQEFGGKPWTRSMLVNTCKYMYLSNRFMDLWDDCLKDGDCPIEAKSIKMKFDRNELFLG